jgi:ATP-dependent exoDNAse (exonuclease V) beta subunit
MTPQEYHALPPFHRGGLISSTQLRNWFKSGENPHGYLALMDDDKETGALVFGTLVHELLEGKPTDGMLERLKAVKAQKPHTVDNAERIADAIRLTPIEGTLTVADAMALSEKETAIVMELDGAKVKAMPDLILCVDVDGVQKLIVVDYKTTKEGPGEYKNIPHKEWYLIQSGHYSRLAEAAYRFPVWKFINVFGSKTHTINGKPCTGSIVITGDALFEAKQAALRLTM